MSETPLTEPRLLPPREEMERALFSGDASYDGIFIVAVRTTGIFCLPSCRPPRRPKPENVEFFSTIPEAVFAGYRPCKLCRPLELEGGTPVWVEKLLARVEQSPHTRIQAGDLRGWGLSPERVRRWFQQHYGMTFAAWCRGRRLSEAFTQIREGVELDEVALGHGYTSHSGFREAFGQTFGQPPGRVARKTSVVRGSSAPAVVRGSPDPAHRPTESLQRIVTTMLDSPVGRMLAATTDEGICLLEYTDRRMLERNLETMRRRFALPVVPGEHRWLQQLADELRAYFARSLTEFTVPVAPRGTPFQERVWQELRRIPHGTTISYEDLATRIGQPTAVRAVANANGQNRINILIPCHRVIGKNGDLTGYGGGLWRKRLLLELERTTFLE
ncbi:MAG: methylated-DNA--[protein]-cysteine S-methyltransferase [Planctomycetota bacterium]